MGQDALPNLAAFALQVCIIVAVGTLLLAALRIASAGARYACWRIVLAACLAMPFLLQRPATPESVAQPRALAVAEHPDPGAGPATVPAAVTPTPAAPEKPAPPWSALAMFVIGAGAVVRAAWLAIGLCRLRGLRRRGVTVNDDEYADIQATLGTRAMLLSVTGLKQPATFGLWRSVVLLPDTLVESPATLRRAVVTHELFHVQRRDWLWVLAEEALRTVLWFHPAIAWLTSRIQLAREELVDELTVLATGNRKAYIEALLAFADAGRVSPAPAFARQRHLFIRIVRLSKERVMSSPRIVLSAATVVAAVLTTGWYASSAFPILSAAPVVAPAEAALPSTTVQPSILPRYQIDRVLAFVAGQSGPVISAQPGDLVVAAPVPVEARPGPKTQTATQHTPDWNDYWREAADRLRTLAELNSFASAQGARSGGPRPGPAAVAPVPAPVTKPITPENPIPRRLSSVPVPYPSQLRGSGYRASLMVRVTLDASGTVSDVSRVSLETAGNDPGDQQGRVAAMTAFMAAALDAIRQWRYQPPADPPIAFFVAVTFEGERDARTEQSESPTAQGRLAAVRFASPQRTTAPADMERLLAEMTVRRAELAQRLSPDHPDLQRLDEQIREVERVKNLQLRGAVPSAIVGGPGATAATPVRVGGNIRPPAKTRHVDPAYPETAKSARVQGVVIIEATIDEQGRVAEARILRSIPLLDQAALDAVRQWEFTPTLLNGAPVPIIMTMTVQFVLPAQ